ncbi:adenylate/guanylate cyclase domain-containing protein [Enterovirga aerilata]|uniref:adenylate/guanylate cyclase domain-containing protein n=1 Tax=Enterovirga aerilata TaxID=2730920 RepID=UPI003211DD44
MWGAVRRRITVRNVRLASGLVLLAYVTSHFLNHALGNLSLAAMEAGLDWVAWFWGLPGLGTLLYGALAIHAGLALWSIYARPRHSWTTLEVLQLGIGLSLPFLLAGHVVTARLGYELYGDGKTYSQLLHLYFVAAPSTGLRQGASLLLAWTHAAIGLFFWLRLKPGFPAIAPVLLCAAVLVPLLALLGIVQGGREVVALAADEGWRAANGIPSGPLPDEAAARIEVLERWQDAIAYGFLAALAGAFAARGLRHVAQRRRGLVRVTYADGRAVEVPRGTSVLEASRIGRIPHASVCGGRGRCSTCRVRVFGAGATELPPPSPAEAGVLERIEAGPQVRLACQLRPGRDVQVAPLIAPWAGPLEARRIVSAFGEERFVVAMFVDMRGSTRFAETHLPFDTVFLINRFLDAVSRAVLAAGGVPNQFLGDGLLALFGLATDPRSAAREALAAAAGVGREIATLNGLMAADAGGPIRFGIGVHCGTAILGEIGGRASGRPVFTAIGDPVNVAARLQSATKRLGVEAAISEAVYRTAGYRPDAELRELQLDGREGTIAVRAVARAVDAPGASDQAEIRRVDESA